MTKKDYELFANEINKMDNLDEQQVLMNVTARVFAKNNPLFKNDKYKRACLEGKHIRSSIKAGV